MLKFILYIMQKRSRSLVIIFSFLIFTFFLFQSLPHDVFAQTPSFHCLGSCPTHPASPTTSIPVSSAPISSIPASPAKTEPSPLIHENHDVEQKVAITNKGRKKHKNKGRGFIKNVIDSFFQLIIQLLNLFFGKFPPVVPVPQPTPSPVISSMPSMIMPTASPSAISVADIKYIPGNEPLKVFNIIAEIVGDKWTYNGTSPGPEIRVNQGDHLRINLLNKLPEATSIHSHGIVLPASQDGVPGVTQNSVKPGEMFTYDFVVPHVGTYWYHTHQNTLNQLPKGLIGSLIVMPPQQAFDRDYTVQFRNLTATESGEVMFQALPGERVRLRLINSRNGDFSGAPVKAALVGAPFKVIALDGHDINAPQAIQNQILPIGMAQRFDLEFTMPESGSVQLVEIDKLQTITIGDGIVGEVPDLNMQPVFSFVNYGVPAPDPRLPSTVFDLDYTLTIGQNLSVNGQLPPNIPPMVVKKGQLVRIRFVNNSNMTHPMHYHGHIFSVLKINEQPLSGSPIHLDTILIPPGETAEVAFLADNNGMWMHHCHVLAHAVSGLMMMVNYENVYTPYLHGPDSGNIPE